MSRLTDRDLANALHRLIHEHPTALTPPPFAARIPRASSGDTYADFLPENESDGRRAEIRSESASCSRVIPHTLTNRCARSRLLQDLAQRLARSPRHEPLADEKCVVPGAAKADEILAALRPLSATAMTSSAAQR